MRITVKGLNRMSQKAMCNPWDVCTRPSPRLFMPVFISLSTVTELHVGAAGNL